MEGSSPKVADFVGENIPIDVGENTLQAEVEETNQRRELENDLAAWLDKDFVDKDDNIPFDANLEVERKILTNIDA